MTVQQDSDTGNVECAALESCPQCDYSLRGLPANHNCPECGLAYDEYSAIWRQRPRKRELVFTIIITLSMTYMLFQSARFLPEFLQVLFFIVVLLVLISQTIWFWSLCRDGRFVAIMPHGMILRIDQKNITCLSWSDITDAFVTPLSPGAIITLKTGKNIGISHIFSTLAESKAFVMCAEAQRARHGKRSGCMPEPRYGSQV